MGIVIGVIIGFLILVGISCVVILYVVINSTAATPQKLKQIRAFFADKQWNKVLAEYPPAISKAEGDIQLLSLLAFLPRMADRKKTISIMANKANAHLAEAYCQTGDEAKGMELLNALIKSGHGDAGDYSKLIELHILKGELAPAKKLLEQLKEHSFGLKDRLRGTSGNPDVYLANGFILAQEGKSSEAVEELQRALELDADYEDRAVRAAQVLLEQDSEHCEANRFLGEIYEKRGNHLKALESYKKTLGSSADDRPMLEKMAVLYRKSNRYEQAASCYEKILAEDPENIQVLKEMLQVLQRQGATKRLVALYEKLIEMQPDTMKHHQELAKLYQNSKQFDDAIRTISHMIELKPEKPDNYFSLAELYMRTGQSEKALLAYERLMQQNLSLNDFVMLKKVTSSLENILKADTKNTDALRLLVLAQDKMKLDSTKYRYRLAKARYSRQEYDDAFALFQQLWKDESDYQDKSGIMMGQCWLQQHNTDLALRHFQQMLEMPFPPEMKREIAYYVGIANEELKNWQEAKQTYGDILLTVMEYKDVKERFEKCKKQIEAKRQKEKPSAVAGMAGSTVTDVTIARFELKEELGKGGMGIVYRAHDTKLDRDVALKVLLTTSQDSKEFGERLIREARAAAILNHPNIIAIYDVNDTGSSKYIAMEIADGGSLRELIGESPSGLPEGIAKKLFLEFANAMAFAHGKGIVHRDIKPENIMLDAANHIKVTDFGLARMETSSTITQPGMAVGTVQYMAPEQIKGEKPTPLVDIYAGGCMLFEMLTGKVPFAGTDIASIIYNHMNVEPASITDSKPDIHENWQAIVAKMMAKDTAARYASFDDVSADLMAMPVIAVTPEPRAVPAVTDNTAGDTMATQTMAPAASDPNQTMVMEAATDTGAPVDEPSPDPNQTMVIDPSKHPH